MVPDLGIMGVAVGALTAAALSAFVLVVLTYKRAGLSVYELLTLIVSWLVWGVVCFATNLDSFATNIICVFGLGALMWVQLQVWQGSEKGV